MELLGWGKASGLAVDPVEKKPLFHFLPGTGILSLGTVGCNFGCEFCQNYSESQRPKQKGVEVEVLEETIVPEELVSYCVSRGIKAIAFTYNEPTIWAEFAVEVMMLAKKKKILGVFVSNGFMSFETLDFIDKYIDAFNIDLKSFSEKFYKEVCHARLAPVLRNIEEIYKRKKWLEVTTLLIPGKNDSTKEIRSIAKFIAGISKSIPWHVTAFHPDFKMTDLPKTSEKKLLEAAEIGKEEGLRYVYTGNIGDWQGQSTFCPRCGKEVVRRLGYMVENKLESGKCTKCGYKIEGVWD
jgi:pyruvate formate lyase activating enzyme